MNKPMDGLRIAEGSTPPVLIDVEAEFTQHVQSFEDGARVVDVIKRLPKNSLNADFYFSKSKVIAELKCLKSDGSDRITSEKRMIESYRHFGYTEGVYRSHLLRGERIPDRILKNFTNKIERPIFHAVRKANKQIISTKKLLKVEDCRGLLLFSNDRNYLYSPKQMLQILSNAVGRLSDNHIDGFVYFTPNIYYNTDENNARQLWLPLYEPGSEELSEFVNELGSRWCDRLDTAAGRFHRVSSSELPDSLLNSRPLEQLRLD